MRFHPYLTLAMVPAALVAQSPAATDYNKVLKEQSPAVENLLKDFHPVEALQKAEALLPASLPAFDKSGPAAAMQASLSFSGLTRLYLLNVKAAAMAGEWEKTLDLLLKAQACAKVNYESTKEALSPLQATWTQAIEQANKGIADGADRIAAIKAKPGRNAAEEAEYQAFVAKDRVYNNPKNPAEKNEAAKYLKANLPRFQELEAKALTPQDQQDLAALKQWQTNLVNGPKAIKAIQESIDATKAEYDSCTPKIESFQKSLKDESEEIAKGVAAVKVKGKVVKETSGPKYDEKRLTYFQNVMKTKANYESRTTKLDKLNFLFRLRHNVAGTANESKVNEIIDRVRADQDPFPAEKKAPAKGKKAK
ncbi:hypothetical protein [Mesoterricola silvestris]|uniref:Uncharacterized protein n=1 Tax=Mesoterricola silvestris TaxID=2927979 RepID=A0AA48GUE3_9BACT|nr:hypothetical protein [Mesoterricola silvestris]BDU74550.1 hypothetical protein METEAL_37240 [Mesoterricola silvestris]